MAAGKKLPRQSDLKKGIQFGASGTDLDIGNLSAGADSDLEIVEPSSAPWLQYQKASVCSTWCRSSSSRASR
jgi:hypothetical protein